MSRVGKLPIQIPEKVTVEVKDDQVQVKGPKGSLQHPIGRRVDVKVEDGEISVALAPGQRATRQATANWGTTRSIISNMIVGVTDGWSKELELQGVGFTASLSGKSLTLATGYSHKSTVSIPDGINCKVEKQSIVLEGQDRQLVGLMAAKIRDVCPPEPYLGKGIRYKDEQVKRKAGKAGAK